MKLNIFIFITILSFSAFSDNCVDWFNSSGIAVLDKECISKCNVYPKDMGTFSCSNECDKFCTSQKCKIDPFFKDKIKLGRPNKWGNDSEKTVDWSVPEKEQVEKTLNRLPDELKKLSLDGVYRMKKSSDIVNPGSTSEDGQAIVLYDRAFGHPNWTTDDVLLHELGHMVYAGYTKAEQDKYKSDLGWKNDQSRTDGFVSSRAKDDPIEDFAENFKYLLLYPDDLKRINDNAFKWFKKKYKKQLVLKKECL